MVAAIGSLGHVLYSLDMSVIKYTSSTCVIMYVWRNTLRNLLVRFWQKVTIRFSRTMVILTRLKPPPSINTDRLCGRLYILFLAVRLNVESTFVGGTFAYLHTSISQWIFTYLRMYPTALRSELICALFVHGFANHSQVISALTLPASSFIFYLWFVDVGHECVAKSEHNTHVVTCVKLTYMYEGVSNKSCPRVFSGWASPVLPYGL